MNHDVLLYLPMTWWSWPLAGISLVALWQAGSKCWWAWLLAAACCALWIPYAILTAQYGLAVSSSVSGIICIRNWLTWRKGQR